MVIERSCQMLLWLHSFRGFLFKSSRKTNAKCSSGCPPPLLVVSYSVLIENWCQMLFWRPSSSCGGFLFNDYWKLMLNALLAAPFLFWWFLVQFLLKTDAKCSSDCLPPLVVVSYSFSIEKWCRMRFWLPPPLVMVSYSILIQFLLKTDATCSSGWPPLVVSHSILVGNDAKCSSGWLLPLVVVSCSVRIENWC